MHHYRSYTSFAEPNPNPTVTLLGLLRVIAIIWGSSWAHTGIPVGIAMGTHGDRVGTHGDRHGSRGLAGSAV